MDAFTAIMEEGYTIGDRKLARGYVSRKTTLETAEVKTAQGRRKGQKYFLWPHETSTQYHYRVYLK